MEWSSLFSARMAQGRWHSAGNPLGACAYGAGMLGSPTGHCRSASGNPGGMEVREKLGDAQNFLSNNRRNGGGEISVTRSQSTSAGECLDVPRDRGIERKGTLPCEGRSSRCASLRR
jgi:hypothetical protein